MKSFKEYLSKIKPARPRHDLDRCAWLTPLLPQFPIEKHILKIVNKKPDGTEQTRYEYSWATRTYEHQGRSKVYRVTIQAGYWQEIFKYLTVMVKARIPVNLAHETLMQHTNICMNHAYGACPHLECGYSHDESFHGVMVKYIDSLNIMEDSKHHKRPAQMTEVIKWKDTINHLFQYWTGKPCADI